MPTRAIAIITVSLLALAVVAPVAPAAAQEVPLEPYPLDAIGRQVEVTGKMRCPVVPLQPYAGDAIRWKSQLQVHPAFATRLAAFEAVVAAVATRVYGRAPSRITHLGSFNCRRIRRYPDLLSEHGLGNAIDVAGFEFPALSRADAKASDLPRALKRSFKVTVLDHWNGDAKDSTARASGRGPKGCLEKGPEGLPGRRPEGLPGPEGPKGCPWPCTAAFCTSSQPPSRRAPTSSA